MYEWSWLSKWRKCYVKYPQYNVTKLSKLYTLRMAFNIGLQEFVNFETKCCRLLWRSKPEPKRRNERVSKRMWCVALNKCQMTLQITLIKANELETAVAARTQNWKCHHCVYGLKVTQHQLEILEMYTDSLGKLHRINDNKPSTSHDLESQIQRTKMLLLASTRAFAEYSTILNSFETMRVRFAYSTTVSHLCKHCVLYDFT